MAENITLNPGAGGDTLATDEASSLSSVGLAEYQVIKVAYGPVNTRTLVENSAGAAFPVSIVGALNNISATVNAVLGVGAANIGFIDKISATVNAVIGAGVANIGIIDRVSATSNVVIGAGVANIGFINNISATVNAVLGAGAANIGTINNISATAAVVIGVGAANIGFINNISATVNVVVGAGVANIGTINNISATAAVVIGVGAANIGFINNISATVVVAGVIDRISATVTAILAAGIANIGFINNISATVNVVVGAGVANIGLINNISATVNVTNRPWDSNPTYLVPVAGAVSTVAGTAVIGAPGVASAINVMAVMATNKSAAIARIKLSEDSPGSTIRIMADAASGGGGFVWKGVRPWRLEANKGLRIFCSPAVSDVAFTIEYFVAP